MATEMTESELVSNIQALSAGSGTPPTSRSALHALRNATAELIHCCEKTRSLYDHPFSDVLLRRLPLHRIGITDAIEGKVILVTGAEGCVGSALIQRLRQFKPHCIIGVDKARCCNGSPAGQVIFGDHAVYYAADVCDLSILREIFCEQRPEVVFHLAAQRNPGLAEHRVWETVRTNVIGTRNVIRVCEDSQVKVCVFSSTGKASRYYTREVYAATKKLAEWQLAMAAKGSDVNYGIVRFTHILENSLVQQEFERCVSERRPVGVHGPGRIVVAQNVNEATGLLLNSVALAKRSNPVLAVVRDLGWPVETLELALHQIKRGGAPLPLYIKGVPRGYEEGFFRGQVDWRFKNDVHLLLNVLESPGRSLDETGEMILTHLAPFSTMLVEHQVARLQDGVHAEGPAEVLSVMLTEAIRAICLDSFSRAPDQELLNILRWGTEIEHPVGHSNEYHAEIVELLMSALLQNAGADWTAESVTPALKASNLAATVSNGFSSALALSNPN
jgi:nucleoside-diphosphate-sugar epimerase